MANGRFNDAECGRQEVEALGLDNQRVLDCMGSSWEDAPHPLLQVRARRPPWELEGI